MKLFKRAAKDADALTPSAPKTARNSRSTLLPGVLAALGGIILAGALLWFGPLNSAYQQHLQQLSQAWGGGQATVLQKALQQLSADTQAAARNPQLLQALQSQDINQIRSAERNLTYWHGVVDAHLNARAQAVQDMNRSAPMNFAALDMLRRAESGQTPAPEAYKVGQRWLVYSAAPLRLKEGEPLHGTLLLAVDLERLLANLPAMPAEIGQIQLIQQFNNTAAQVLAQRGDAQGSAQTFSTGNPNWSVSFTPGPSLTNSVFSPLLLAIAGLLALTGAIVGLYLLQSSLQRRLRADVLQLGQMLRELSAGKAIKPFSLSLPALDILAQSLARPPRRASEPAAAAAADSGERTAMQTPASVMALLINFWLSCFFLATTLRNFVFVVGA
jgi:phosphomannomutase/phosphoglucomutase